jgi:hypothetical protein
MIVADQLTQLARRIIGEFLLTQAPIKLIRFFHLALVGGVERTAFHRVAPQGLVRSFACKQLCMRTLLDNLAALHNDDVGSRDNARQPMRGYFQQRVVQCCLGGIVQGAGRLIEQQDGGVAHERASNCQTLLPAAWASIGTYCVT